MRRTIYLKNRFNAINKYRIERWCYLHKLKPIALIVRSYIYLIHNSYIPPQCEIGEGTLFGYKGIGVIIHSDSVIGKNCIIGSNVTVGGGGGNANLRNRIEEFDSIRRKVPVIGDNVEISTGAKIIGSVVIGDNVIIGANAVVLHDIPSNAVAVGVPARVISIKSENE